MNIAAFIRRIRGRDTVAGIMSQFTAAIGQLEELAAAEAEECNRCMEDAQTLRDAAAMADDDANAAARRADEATNMAAKLRATFS